MPHTHPKAFSDRALRRTHLEYSVSYAVGAPTILGRTCIMEEYEARHSSGADVAFHLWNERCNDARLFALVLCRHVAEYRSRLWNDYTNRKTNRYTTCNESLNYALRLMSRLSVTFRLATILQCVSLSPCAGDKVVNPGHVNQPHSFQWNEDSVQAAENLGGWKQEIRNKSQAATDYNG
jgi:hypothetical protein